MLLGKITEAGMKSADRLHGAIASIASRVGLEPCVDSITHEGSDRSSRAFRPRSQSSCRFVGELDLHTCHVQTVAPSSRSDGMRPTAEFTEAPRSGARPPDAFPLWAST